MMCSPKPPAPTPATCVGLRRRASAAPSESASTQHSHTLLRCSATRSAERRIMALATGPLPTVSMRLRRASCTSFSPPPQPMALQPSSGEVQVCLIVTANVGHTRSKGTPAGNAMMSDHTGSQGLADPVPACCSGSGSNSCTGSLRSDLFLCSHAHSLDVSTEADVLIVSFSEDVVSSTPFGKEPLLRGSASLVTRSMRSDSVSSLVGGAGREKRLNVPIAMAVPVGRRTCTAASSGHSAPLEDVREARCSAASKPQGRSAVVEPVAAMSSCCSLPTPSVCGRRCDHSRRHRWTVRFWWPAAALSAAAATGTR
mmetsp:Transcript_40617/g.129076  ORF Transcript_40617/g.129076 Transcript_40617/m.129076 type:complete len:313 (+) Transcript_40617:990-1928(+)